MMFYLYLYNDKLFFQETLKEKFIPENTSLQLGILKQDQLKLQSYCEY